MYLWKIEGLSISLVSLYIPVFFPTECQYMPFLPNLRFAYVDFATPEAKTIAIALSEQPLVGRKLLIKDGQSRVPSLWSPSTHPT